MVKNSSKIGTAVSYEMENQIKELVSAGKYISTSHFIREAIKLLLKKELKDNKTIIFKKEALEQHINNSTSRYLPILLENIKNLKIRINELEKENKKEKVEKFKIKLNSLEREQEESLKNIEYCKELLNRNFTEEEYFKALKGKY